MKHSCRQTHWLENSLVQPTLENCLKESAKANISLPYELQPRSWICLCASKPLYKNVPRAALFLRASNSAQARCPSTREWMANWQHIRRRNITQLWKGTDPWPIRLRAVEQQKLKQSEPRLWFYVSLRKFKSRRAQLHGLVTRTGREAKMKSNDVVITKARIEVTSGGWRDLSWDGRHWGFRWLPRSIPWPGKWWHDFMIICYIVHLHVVHFFWGGYVFHIFQWQFFIVVKYT